MTTLKWNDSQTRETETSDSCCLGRHGIAKDFGRSHASIQISSDQIIRESNVSHSTGYRKIGWLLDNKLLIVDKIEITEDGKKSSLFRTVLKSFNVKYEYNSVVIEAEQNFDTLKRITENFFILPDLD